jgi:hypothetical protein
MVGLEMSKTFKQFNSFYIVTFPYQQIYPRNIGILPPMCKKFEIQINKIAPDRYIVGAIRFNETVEIWFDDGRSAFDAYFQLVLPYENSVDHR